MQNIGLAGVSIDDVLGSYKTYLKVKYPYHLEELIKRERSNVDAVRLEVTSPQSLYQS